MRLSRPEPDPRLIRLAERIGLNPSQTAHIHAVYEEDDTVNITATVVVSLTYAEFRAVWDGEPEPPEVVRVSSTEAALTETIARLEGITPREAFRLNERRAYWQGVRDAIAVVRGQRDALRGSSEGP